MSDLVVTGSSGYLGRELLARAADAFGFSRSSPEAVDVRDEQAVLRVLERERPRRVIHTAYVQTGPDARSIVVDGSAAVARCCARVGADLVHMSTDVVFDGRLGRPYRPDDAPNPVTGYGRNKLDAELAVRDACPAATIVRTSLLYGGAEPSNHERLALEPGDTTFFTDEIRCPTRVGDLADALLSLGPGGGVVHLVGSDAVSRLEFARIVRAASGLDPDDLRGARAAELGVKRPLDLRLEPATLPGVRP